MVDKIAVFVLVVLAGWAFTANLAVFRYHRANDGSLEENKKLGTAEVVVRIVAGLVCASCFKAFFTDGLATWYVNVFSINPQATFLGKILVTLTALIIGVLHLVINFVLCEALTQANNYYLLRTIQSAPDQPEPLVYGTAEPIRVERAPCNIKTDPRFTMKACDLAAAMKDAGWRLNREPKAPAIPAPETTTINV